MPTQIQISSNARAIIAQVRRTRSLVLDGLRKGLNDENAKTIVALTLGRMGYSKAGPVMPDGLRRISSTAVRSLRATPAVVSGNGVASSLGSNLRYLIAHEFGFSGTVAVRGYTRRNEHADTFRTRTGTQAAVRERVKFGPGRDRLIAKATGIFEVLTRAQAARAGGKLGKAVAQGISIVKPHAMKMNLPARHMIRDTLAARIPNYAATLSAAIVAAHTALRDAAASAPVEPMNRTP